MKKSINLIVEKIKSILQDNFKSFYLYGSVVSKDYRHGWSDIDFVCFIDKPIEEFCAEKLLMLRQEMMGKYPKNKFFRKFEGCFISLDAFLDNRQEKIVYWGTRGQKIKEGHCLDVFARYELKHCCTLIAGDKVDEKFIEPSFEEMKQAICQHYKSIREHAVVTDQSLYSCGWLLDISRCIFTLKHQTLISKTKAGRWALKKGVCPCKKDLKRTLRIRKQPLRYKEKQKTKQWLCGLGDKVQNYANVLQEMLGSDL